jgi:hypothetical protein
MKKKWILPVAVVTGILLLCVAVVLVFGAVLSAKGYGISAENMLETAQLLSKSELKDVS